MIIDGVNVLDLALGANRRIVQDGDTQLAIPSTILPVLLNIRRTQTGIQTGTPQEQSVLSEANQATNNAATSSVSIMTLQGGLWELELILCSQFDFSNAFGSLVTADITLNYKGLARRLLSRIASIGTFTDYQRMRVLLEDNCQMNLRNGTTGAAEHMTTLAIVNAIRVL